LSTDKRFFLVFEFGDEFFGIQVFNVIFIYMAPKFHENRIIFRAIKVGERKKWKKNQKLTFLNMCGETCHLIVRILNNRNFYCQGWSLIRWCLFLTVEIYEKSENCMKLRFETYWKCVLKVWCESVFWKCVFEIFVLKMCLKLCLELSIINLNYKNQFLIIFCVCVEFLNIYHWVYWINNEK